jgi:hypothetical protein
MKKSMFALVLALAGCDDGGTQDTGFADFVADQIVKTADDTDPAPVNDLDFPDAGVEDEDLFTGLLD